MSIVLEALEKAQRENVEKYKKDIPEQSSSATLKKEKHKEPGSKITIPKAKNKKLFIGHSVYFWSAIACIAVVNLLLLGRLLQPEEKNNSPVSLPETQYNKAVNVSIPSVRLFSDTKPNNENSFEEKGYPELNIKGVVWDPQQPLVLVNGEFLTEGDTILGAKIKKIHLDRVTFLYNNEEFTLSVQQ